MIFLEELQKALLLNRDGDIENSQIIFEKLMKENPDNALILSSYGLFYISIEDYDKACELLKKASELSRTFGTLSALGIAEYKRENYKDAAAILADSLTLGENIDIYDKLISSLFEIKQNSKAASYIEKMCELYPDDTRSIINKIKYLTCQGQMLEAEKLCIENLRKNPENSALWLELGFLKELIYCDDKSALECYKAVEQLGRKDTYYNIAVSLQKLQRFDEAEEYYAKMLEYFPNEPDTISSFGMCKLTQKKFKEGYDLFFKRDKKAFEDLSNNFWQPGQEIDEEINIICDQGYGDHIQFVRYLPFLKGKKINVGTRTALMKLFKTNYTDVNFVKYEELNPNLQTFFITDLAYVLNMDFNHIPFSEGYLNAEKKEINNSKLKVGFCWEAGAAGIRGMINRTINIKFFEKMLNLDNIQVYSFQVTDSLNGNEKYPQMINLAKEFNDFYDTACSLKSMDVVVTVDTALAHLAGALGVKTYLLLPYTTDWRWFNDTERTPWYNSIEIFKQKDNISFEFEINEIVKRLAN